MDSNVNAGNIGPGNTPDPLPKPQHHPDTAEPGPLDTGTGQPDHHAEVSALKTWLRQNTISLTITAVIVALVCIYLDPIDTLKVVIGLGLVIFIHELGHFLAAKWCDVHVKTFSIGFGPAVPFCSYKWGETTYMVGIIPLGGYVSMVGENTGEGVGDADADDEDNDPRSFKNKSVGKRMLIISAGVIMNIIMGMGCFVAAYLHGVREKPASVAYIESGSAAWRAGMRTGDEITRIDGRDRPFFDDLRPVVMNTLQGEKVPVWVRGREQPFEVEPIRDEGVPFPQLGVGPPTRLVLMDARKRSVRPVTPKSPAAATEPPFERGDRIVGMTDPLTGQVTTLPRDDEGQPSITEYRRRMVLLAAAPGGRPVTFQVLRKGQPDGAAPTLITVAPSFRADLGLRMQMGKIVAIRVGGPAAAAGVQPIPLYAPPTSPADQIVAIGLPGSGGGRRWLAIGERPAEARPGESVEPLDPILLPHVIDRWAFPNPAADEAAFRARPADEQQVQLVVLRQGDHTEHRQQLTLAFDPSFRFDWEQVNLPNSPLPVCGLGLAYHVNTVVAGVDPVGAAGRLAATDRAAVVGGAAFATTPPSPAAAAGLQVGDLITAVRFKAIDAAGNVKLGDWTEIKSHQWASVDAALQGHPPHELDLRVKRGDQVFEASLTGQPDAEWPTHDRGLVFQYDYQTQRAEDVGDALRLGGWRTVRFIQMVYMNLYGMIRGRISPKTLSGPLTIASVSYKIAGEDFWQFLIFLGMISVNLAVVNFLPIPVLDGGHMVFLIYEKITGRPVPERLFAILMYTGLFLILGLFVFVITRDVGRLFFGWL